MRVPRPVYFAGAIVSVYTAWSLSSRPPQPTPEGRSRSELRLIQGERALRDQELKLKLRQGIDAELARKRDAAARALAGAALRKRVP